MLKEYEHRSNDEQSDPRERRMTWGLKWKVYGRRPVILERSENRARNLNSCQFDSS
jgi:hypothetical protein